MPTVSELAGALGAWLRTGQQADVDALADMLTDLGDAEAGKILREGSPILIVHDSESATYACDSFEEIERSGRTSQRIVAGGVVARRAFSAGVACGSDGEHVRAGEPFYLRMQLQTAIQERLSEEKRLQDEYERATGGRDCGRCGKEDCDGRCDP